MAWNLFDKRSERARDIGRTVLEDSQRRAKHPDSRRGLLDVTVASGVKREGVRGWWRMDQPFERVGTVDMEDLFDV